MRTKIIIITGKAQSGKDTAAEFITKSISRKGFSVKTYPFAKPLKDMCINIFGLDKNQCWGSNKEKDTKTNIKWKDLPLCAEKLGELLSSRFPKTKEDFMTGREVMQILGTEIFRAIDEDCWVRSVASEIKKDNVDFAIISDARFPNEIEFLMNYDPLVIKLNRNTVNSNHDSETALERYNFNHIKEYFEINNQNMSIAQKNEQINNIILKYI